MNKEKILAFLNFDTGKTPDKFMMNLFTCFNVSFGIFVILGGSVLKLISLTWFNILFIAFSTISNILFFLFIRVAKKQIQELFLYFFASLCSVLTLIYGWDIFSKGELIEYTLPRFTWSHTAGLVASLTLSLYMILRFSWVLKLLKDNTLDDARTIVQQKIPNSMPVVIVATLAFVYMVQGILESLELGIGLCLWLLMCVWLFFLLIISFRMFVVFKYKVYKWFD